MDWTGDGPFGAGLGSNEFTVQSTGGGGACSDLTVGA